MSQSYENQSYENQSYENQSYEDSLLALQQAILDKAPEPLLSQLDCRSDSLMLRLGVYTQGYRQRLSQAVLSDYPTLGHYLGPSILEPLVLAYVEEIPSTFYSLDVYPFGFAAWLQGRLNDPFAWDLATLESAINQVFWLPDSAPLVFNEALTLDQFTTQALRPRQAARILALAHSANAYLAQVRKAIEPASPQPEQSFLLVVRHQNEVRRHALSCAEYRILSELFAGKFVGDALETILQNQPDLTQEVCGNLQEWFGRWIREGFFAT